MRSARDEIEFARSIIATAERDLGRTLSYDAKVDLLLDNMPDLIGSGDACDLLDLVDGLVWDDSDDPPVGSVAESVREDARWEREGEPEQEDEGNGETD